MSVEYCEYLELFEYFGRGAQVRLRPEEFVALHGELETLIAQGPPWQRDQAARIIEIRDLLLRDRPKAEELTRGLVEARGGKGERASGRP